MLDGAVQAIFGAAFSGFYLDGTITRVTRTDDGAGDFSETTQTEPCKYQIDALTDQQRQEQGYTARDVRIFVLQSGMSLRPSPGNRVTTHRGEFVVAPNVTEDPAGAYWQIRGTPA